jgi:hypothetical protein
MDTDRRAVIEDLATPHKARQAYWALRRFGPGVAEDARSGLRHESPAVRLWCVRLLDHFFEPQMASDLLTMLDDPAGPVRSAALHTLACDRCKAPGMRPDRTELLPRAIALLADDPNRYVRAMAAEVVGAEVHSSSQAERAFVKAAESDPAPSVRKKAGWFIPGGPIWRRTVPHESRNRRRT